MELAHKVENLVAVEVGSLVVAVKDNLLVGLLDSQDSSVDFDN